MSGLLHILLLYNRGAVLDCGAGLQRYRRLCKNLKYVSQDFCEYEGASRPGIDGKDGDFSEMPKPDIISDIIDIPVESESFEYCLCTEVLEHIPRPELAIKEIYRILKQGGIVFLTAPFMSCTHFAPFHFCTGFNKFWWEKILRDNHFKIVEIQSSGNYFSSLAWNIRSSIHLAEKYSRKCSLFQKLILILATRILNQKSRHDTGSQEYCNFEYFIMAKKI